MTEKKNLQQRLQNYHNFRKERIEPVLEEIWHFRAHVITALLSLCFFALIDQILEVYRIFALNPLATKFQIIISFVFILLLSFSMWKTAETLAKKRMDDLDNNADIRRAYDLLRKKALKVENQGEDQREISKLNKAAIAKAKALRWLPVIFAISPLIALDWGLFRTIWDPAFGVLENNPILNNFWIALTVYTIIIVTTIKIVSKYEVFLSCLIVMLGAIYAINISDFLKGLLHIDPAETPHIVTMVNLVFGIIFTMVFSIIYFIVNDSFSVYYDEAKLKNGEKLDKPKEPYRPLGFIFVSIIAILIFTLPLVIDDLPLWVEAFPAYLGSISIIALFLFVFVTLTSLIFYWSDQTKIPVMSILLIYAIGISFLDRNDNHRFDTHPFPKKRLEDLTNLETEFEKWRQSRVKDISNFNAQNPKKSYPIYLVSAQGGGIYAAYHAASTLSRLQDLCPAFAHHVFAISGVSGGSLGATVFTSLVKSEQTQSQDEYQQKCGKESTNDGKALQEQKRGPLETKAHELLNQDLLSPLLAAGLFPDFIQRFIFYSFDELDRARGLERAFEQSWGNITWEDKKKQHTNLLEGSYYDHWKPESAAPALVLNTTVVETGERLLLSPFTYDSLNFPNLVDISSVAFKEMNGYGLRWMSVDISDHLVNEGRNLVLVALVGTDIHVRIFNPDGKRVVDKAESELVSGNTLTDLKNQLKLLPDESGLSKEQKQKFIRDAFSIAAVNTLNFPLSTAAVLSARFPFVTPVGWFDRSSNKEGGNIKSRLADGGYFENSGFSTAYEIGQGLEKIIATKIKENKGNKNYPENLEIIYLAITDLPKKYPDPGGLGELSSPMNALFNARDARGRSNIKQAEFTLNSPLNDHQKNVIGKYRVRQFYLNHFKTDLDTELDYKDEDENKGKVQPCTLNEEKNCLDVKGKPIDDKSADIKLPLGWYLSEFSKEYISNRIGNPEACPADDSSNNHPNVSNNHCIMKSVIAELSIKN
ncbi:MAG: hypothetical protein PHY16_10960 [Methylobacter sp.]|nr:hypothetical protein [Methylobacter sp.]